MSENPLRARGSVVDALSSALDRGGHGLSNVPVLLHRLLVEESWRDFETIRGEQVHYDRFLDFVTTPPLKGLGTEIELVKRIVRDSSETLDLLDEALRGQHGGDRSKRDNITLAPQPSGTSREAGLRRLRKDRPDLHGQVLEGRLSTHAAMVEAGFRRKKISVPVDTPENTARALRRNLSPEDIAELGRLLGRQDE
ncbi:hypothetical protein [Streptomyces sp. 184]|uniref:hypothetical protein n=1 Tax=Streptomyces sp. 184 TaxID=1827526 RepID=UPI00389286FE